MSSTATQLANISEASEDNKNNLIHLVRRWGGASSDAILDPACQIFRAPQNEGIIGYRFEAGCVVVFGDPICSKEDVPSLVLSFHEFCKLKGKPIIYVAASHEFTQWALKNTCKGAIAFGELLSLNPQLDPRSRTGVNASLVRRKVKRAAKDGLIVEEYTTNDNIALESAIENVGESWLKNRRGIQIYISHVHLFEDRSGKRYFYAKIGEKVVGIVILNQLKKYKGWLLNHLMITSNAPNGTPESLVIATVEALKKEGCEYLTFGSVPSLELSQIIGLNKFSMSLARWSYKIARKLLKLDSRKKFWEKFHPNTENNYLLFSQSNLGFREIIGIMRALNISAKT